MSPTSLLFGFGPDRKFNEDEEDVQGRNDKTDDTGTEEESEEEMELLLLCCCDDDDAIDQYPQPTHLFPMLLLAVNVQRSSNIRSFSLTTTVCFLLPREIMHLT